MDKSLVCRVVVPRKNDNHSISTGYAIKKGVVMLSRHALVCDNRNDEEPVILRWETDQNGDKTGNEGEDIKVNKEGEHYPDNADFDIALIECETPPHTPQNLNFLASQSFPQGIKWETHGYPISQRLNKEDIDYPATTIGGTTTSSNSNGKIELDSTTEMNPPEKWAGISGAPIFFGIFLAGIIVEKTDAHINRLEGISLPYLIEKYPGFSELLEIPSDNEKYLSNALNIIKTHAIFSILKGLVNESTVDAEQIYITLTTGSIGSFLEKIVSFQEKHPEQTEQLSDLAFALLPHFIDSAVANNLRNKIETDVICVPYAKAQPIEALMAKIDRRVLAIDVVSNSLFIATYAIPNTPESGDNENDRIKDLTQGLFQDCGGDLLQIPRVEGQTNFLLKQTGMAGLPRELNSEEKVKLINQRLGRDKKHNRPRYYMLCQHKDFEDKNITQRYYQEFKKLYPHCIVIMPSDDFSQVLQDDEDYENLCSVFSPKPTNKDY